MSCSGNAGSSDGAVSTDSALPSASCIPGISIACVGPRACQGFQVCNATGSGFDSCNCGSIESNDALALIDAPAFEADGASDASKDPDNASGPATLKGAVQKGPFLVGSTVLLSALDPSGIPTGQSFSTQTTTNLGDFEISFSYRGALDLQAQGFYYDEVSGDLSKSPIALRALYEVETGGSQGAFINVITHLAHDRALRLLMSNASRNATDAMKDVDGSAADTLTITEAEAQAEGELVAALGIGGTGFRPGAAGHELNEVGADSDENAYLLAVSATLMQAAREQAGASGSVDATLQQMLNTLAADLADDGMLSSTLKDALKKAEQDLDVDLTMDLLQRRLDTIGSSATVASLNRAVDSDGDGYRNSIDTCPLISNVDQSKIPAGAVCKVARFTTWLPNRPSGNYYSEYGFGLFAADFTHSGHVELAVFGPSITGLEGSFLNGVGGGRFALGAAVDVKADPLPVAPYDVDKDGNLDFAFPMGWLKGNGKGQFSDPIPFDTDVLGPIAGTWAPGAIAALSGYTSPAVLVDFNGDHLLDLARLEDAQGYDSFGAVTDETLLVVNLGSSAGKFGPSVRTSQGFPPPYVGARTWLMPADLNHDQYPDLAAVRLAGPIALIALLGDGKGGFRPVAPLTMGGGPGDGFLGGVTMGDFDGDGNSDVAVPDDLGTLRVAFGDGVGGFEPAKETSFSSSDGFGPQFSAADFNGDGKTDLVGTLSSRSDNNYLGLALFLSEGRSFQPPFALRIKTDGDKGIGNGGNVAIKDIDGNGTPDVLFVAADGNGDWTLQTILTNVQR